MRERKSMKNAAVLFAVMVLLLSIFSVAAFAESISNISPGLRALTASKYAKVYTLENKRYYGLYSNTALTSRISNTAWTGESDEIWITGVGVNSSGVAYARIKYPVGSSRITAYMSLRDTFVPGTVTDSARTAVKRYYGLSSRRASAANSSYGIDPGDLVYLLTVDNGWCQVLYPTSTSQWRIAWMTEQAYHEAIDDDDDDSNNDSGDDSDARQAVVAHAESILNYTWPAVNSILLYYNAYSPYTSGGELKFSRSPVTAKGMIRGIPYTLSSNNTGGGQEKTFSQYKALSTANKSALSNIYKYDGGNRISMKYGMSCATFVTDCILQGLTGTGLSSYALTNIHAQSGWRNYITQGSRTTAGYKKLQKGDYLYTGSHVRLVTANSGSSITVIEQAPPDYTRINCSNKKTVSAYLTYNGRTRYYSSTQVCMDCDACRTGTTGTKRASYSYTNLMNTGYYPMYVSYPSKKSSANTWRDSSMSITYSFTKGYTGTSYSDWVKVTGGTSPYKASISSGSLPDGLSLSVLYTNRIYLKGTPKKAGTFNFTLRVTGTHNGYAEKSFSMTIGSSSYKASNEDELLDAAEREERIQKANEEAENIEDVLFDAADLALISGYAADASGGELLFELGQWKDEAGNTLNVTSQKVYVGGKLTDAKVDEAGCFTLKPSDMADDDKDAAVYVTAETDGRILKSKEISISAAGEDQPSKADSQSGCDTGADGAVLLFLLLMAVCYSQTRKSLKI